MLESEILSGKELLDQYKKMRYLWDPKHGNYQNKAKRAQGFSTLLEKYREIDERSTIPILKKRLDNMRTSYQRERKKVKQSIANGDLEPYKPTLWYYESLLFLEDLQPDTERGESFQFNFNQSQNKIYLERRSREGLKRRMERRMESSSSESREVTQGYINIEPLLSSEEDSPQRHQSSKPKNRIYNLLHKQERFVDIASKIITKKESGWQVIGKAIGLQLSGLEHDQRTIAQKLISDVIYFGNLGKLNIDSFINVESSDQGSPRPISGVRDQDPIFEETASLCDNKAYE